MPIPSSVDFRLARIPPWLAAAAAGLCLALAVQAADSSPSQTAIAETAVLTDPGQTWQLSAAERNRVWRFRYEITALFYDPYWNVLWADCGGTTYFFKPTGKALPLRSGDHVILLGTVAPTNDTAIEDARVTRLAPVPPVVPIPVGDNITDYDRLNTKVVTISGLVDRQTVVDPQHVRLEVIANDHRVIVNALSSNDHTVPQLEEALVDLTGLYSVKRDATHAVQDIALWLPRPESIQFKGWLASDPRFDRPATPIVELGHRPADQLVRITGRVHLSEPGRSITIRDDTSEIQVQTMQGGRARAGDTVEAVGYPQQSGVDLSLLHGIWRRSVASLPGQSLHQRALRLRLAGQVMALSGSEARLGVPVTLHGVVTWSNPGSPELFVHDTSGDVRVLLPDDSVAHPPEPGRVINVEGVSSEGEFAPHIAAASLRSEDVIALPPGRSITLDQAFTGSEEAQRVEIQGFLQRVRTEGTWTVLNLTSATGEFVARLPATGQLDQQQGAIIRLRGVCTAQTNARHQLVGIEVWVTSPDDIEIDEAAPADPFDTPEIELGELRRFGTVRVLNRRVRTHGTVVYHDPGHTIEIQEGNDVLELLARATTPLAPGTRVIAVGFPGRESGRVVLREALFKQVAAGIEPKPAIPPSLGTVLLEFDGRLVQAEGTLRQLVPSSEGVRLIVQAEHSLFEAQLPVPVTSAERSIWDAGTKIRLTGVYRVQFDEYRQPRSFQIQLRTPADVRILATAAWWTAERALVLAGCLGLAALLVAIWVAVLARRVNRQTVEIRHQLEKQAKLESELQHATRLESLGLLAGGIAHDFNNLLTVVMGNLTMALLDERVMEAGGDFLKEAERGALRARDLTQQLITFAKGGSPLRTAVSLPEIVREVAGITLRDSPVTCECEVAPDLWTADVDRDQIGEVVRHLALTAQQAMPAGGVLTVDLANEEVAADHASVIAPGRYVRLTFGDTGGGIPAEKLAHIFDPYFTPKGQKSGLGLATVYSIVKRHDGHIAVESVVGRGTTFRIWLPAAAAAPAPISVSLPPSPPSAPARPPRILVMDDEPSIRRLVMRMLERKGYAVTGAADGAAAVHEFTAARTGETPFDLLIFDLTVPGGMGGQEAIALVRQIDPKTRAIVSSGYSDDAALAAFRSQGFDAVVPKPYDVSRLIETVQRLLAEPR